MNSIETLTTFSRLVYRIEFWINFNLGRVLRCLS